MSEQFIKVLYMGRKYEGKEALVNITSSGKTCKVTFSFIGRTETIRARNYWYLLISKDKKQYIITSDYGYAAWRAARGKYKISSQGTIKEIYHNLKIIYEGEIIIFKL